MPTDTMTLMGLGIAAVVVVWLVFSMVRKVFGIVLAIGLAAGLWYLWTNPQQLTPILNWIRQFTG